MSNSKFIVVIFIMIFPFFAYAQSDFSRAIGYESRYFNICDGYASLAESIMKAYQWNGAKYADLVSDMVEGNFQYDTSLPNIEEVKFSLIHDVISRKRESTYVKQSESIDLFKKQTYETCAARYGMR